MTPQEFLATLWAEAPQGWVLLWTAQNKRSTWFKGFHHANQWVEAHRRDMDIYMGVSLAPDTQRPPSDRVRVSSAQSAGIPGLWADIDIAGPEHQKSNLPENIEDALCALTLLGYPPSIIIHSGHGLQCWWLFETPWIFKDEHERRLAQQLAWNWHDALAAEWQTHGWALDNTSDLARVLRVPGTINHKSKPVRVEAIQTSDFRWREFPNLPKGRTADRPTLNLDAANSPAEIGSLDLNPDQFLPKTKLIILQSLQQTIQSFADTWGKNRKFKDGDDSPSAYDMSIAHWCAAAGFTDQEIATAIIEWRRIHGYDLAKVMRQDYMQRTIGKVRANNC